MSGKGIHVHGPHDHEMEHEAQKGGLGQRIAIFTAVLATVGAVVSFLGGHTQNEALYYKNEAVLKKTQASNQWNYYQAKSMKQNLAEFAAGITNDPTKAEKYLAEAKRYSDERRTSRRRRKSSRRNPPPSASALEIVCPANVTEFADSTGTASLGEFTPLFAADECSVSPSIMQSPVACTILKVQKEPYLVTLVAIDNNHNAAACSFRVTLKQAGSRQQAAGSDCIF